MVYVLKCMFVYSQCFHNYCVYVLLTSFHSIATTISQVEMITDLLGTPSLDNMKHITSRTAIKNLLAQQKPPAPEKLYSLSTDVSHGAVHLLLQMLVFNPVSS